MQLTNPGVALSIAVWRMQGMEAPAVSKRLRFPNWPACASRIGEVWRKPSSGVTRAWIGAGGPGATAAAVRTPVGATPRGEAEPHAPEPAAWWSRLGHR